MNLRRLIVLAGVMTMAVSAWGQCRDPWVTEEVKRVKRGAPIVGKGETGECNINLYGRHWNSRADLARQVDQTFAIFDKAGLYFQYERILRDRRNGLAGTADPWVGPKAQAPYHDGQYATPGYWRHVPLPNNFVLIKKDPCKRGMSYDGRACVRGGDLDY
jgi:hypothetical protein